MQATRFSLRRSLVAMIAANALLLSFHSHAQEVKSLRGKPSSDMILEALSPETGTDSAAAPMVRKRGLSLGGSAPAAEPAPAQTSQRPQAQTHAAAAQQEGRAQGRRALDLEIKFQFNSDQLTDDGREVLDQLGTALKSDQLAGARAVILEGHADATGTPAYNQALSLKRAQSSRQYLATRHGIPGSKLKAVGKGSSEPADPNNPQDEVNRRVRVIVDL